VSEWNGFQENAISSIGTLRMENEFADFTLACEDGQQVEVHKVIMASSSPFFLNLLRRNKQPHPLIYMRGLKSEDLVAMVDFLYYGEANVYQENLDSFHAVAEELQLKGVMGSGTEKKIEENIKQLNPKKKIQKLYQPNNYFEQEEVAPKQGPHIISQVDQVETEPHFDGTAAVTDFTVAADLQDLNDKIKSMMTFSENSARSRAKQGRARICKVCGKEGPMANIMNHIEANHISGVSHSCNICGFVAKTRNSIASHTSLKHKKNL